MSKCPFKQGDVVVYKPSSRGHALIDGERLVIGKSYRVECIEKENYVAVEGYHHPGGGIYWTEFKGVAHENQIIRKPFTPILKVYLMLYGIAFLLTIHVGIPAFFGSLAEGFAQKYQANLLDMELNFIVFKFLAASALVGVCLRKPWGLVLALSDLLTSIFQFLKNFITFEAFGNMDFKKWTFYSVVHLLFMILLTRRPQLEVFGLNEAKRSRIILFAVIISLMLQAILFFKMGLFEVQIRK